MRRLKIVLRLAFSYYFMLIILDSKSSVFHLKIQKNFSNSLGAENNSRASTFPHLSPRGHSANVPELIRMFGKRPDLYSGNVMDATRYKFVKNIEKYPVFTYKSHLNSVNKFHTKTRND